GLVLLIPFRETCRSSKIWPPPGRRWFAKEHPELQRRWPRTPLPARMALVSRCPPNCGLSRPGSGPVPWGQLAGAAGGATPTKGGIAMKPAPTPRRGPELLRENHPFRQWKTWTIPGTRLTVVGYSRSNDKTFFHVPELRCCIDAGLCEGRRVDTVFLTHTHHD